MGAVIKIELNEKTYLKDPEQTELGRNIIAESIQLIDTLGFEQFTFKKLAAVINSTEASIYRYFENKHKLLIYLISWYWAWLDYQIDYQTNNIHDPQQRLKIAIRIIADAKFMCGSNHTCIDRMALHRIVVSESAKSYLTKSVDTDNKEGLFKNFKMLCYKIAAIVKEINPDYPYPHALISTIIEAAHHQIFFAEHLPSLTEAKVKNCDYSQINVFLERLIFNAIQAADKR